MGETFYEVLGVPPDATQEEITAAYRDRVLETHPDHSDEPDAAEAFGRVTAAEEVLSDETERARYDRLGHDEYVRLEEGFGTGERPGGATDSARTGPTAESQESGGEDRTNGSAASTGGSAGTTGPADGRDPSTAAGAWDWSNENREGPSHHARQRERRRRAAAAAEAADWWVRDDGPTRTGERTDEETEDDGFSYSVHGWDDEVDLEREDPPLDQGTAVVVACVALLYPVLVYASVAPAFGLFVNVTVAVCTFVLVGYLLTMPKIAMGTFGLWSAIVPYALPRIVGVDPLSLPGLLAVGAFWVPFGYAVAVWWALRP